MKLNTAIFSVASAGVLAAGAAVVQMPPSCTNPDGMAVDPRGRLAVAAPNNDRKAPGAIFLIDSPGAAPRLWFEVPPLAETGYAQPMGLCFGPSGELYVCDCNVKGKGRLLRFEFKDDKPVRCDTVAECLDNANGVKYLAGRLYVTQAFLYGVKRGDGAATSGLFMFGADERGVRPRNDPSDPRCVFGDVTRNPQIACGLNGVAVDGKGNLFVDNYGDGKVWKLAIGGDGRVKSSEVFVPASAGVKSPDGLCVDPSGNLYIADMHGCAAVRVSPSGVVEFLKRGGMEKPSEPCWWKGSLYVANYKGTTLEKIDLGSAR